MAPPLIPSATYRLQLRAGFGFAEAAALVPYLDALGVTDAYASPLLVARPGSTHGYDVVDHAQVNPELGGSAGLERWSDALRARGMGLLVDVVPNHMCVVGAANRWWTDVLENGPSSPFADAFDIDWRPPNPALNDRVLLPILGGQYGQVLEAGEIQVEYRDGAFAVRYHEHVWPLGPKTWVHLLEPALKGLLAQSEEPDPGAELLASIITALGYLPDRSERSFEKVRERAREKEVIKARLSTLMEESATVRAAVTRAVVAINGSPGDPASFDRLDALLREQAYRVAFWRVASDEINYRRFFDINELAALRVEEPRVFQAVHAVVFDLVRAGRVTGLRIDHVDGLLDPFAYLHAVQAGCQPLAPPSDGGLAIYLVVEKILAEGERLPAEWPVHGTTGYDFLNQVGGVFVDPAGSRAMIDLYAGLTGERRPFAEVAYECKKLALTRALASQIAMLARRLDHISEQDRHSRDFTPQDLAAALTEVVACLPVYRTYARPQATGLSTQDAAWVAQAITEAKRRNPAMPASLFDFVGAVLRLECPKGLGEPEREQRRDFTLRLQQLTGGVMAKAIEDTAFYRYYPLSSRGEVGGGPERPGVEVAELHAHNLERLASHPHAMVATSTHDTKRGEDVRARVRVLSEQPAAWAEAFARFRALNAPHRTPLPDGVAPDLNEEWLLYQTLVGVWPFEPPTAAGLAELRERMGAYMNKVLREAKLHSSWVSPNEPWERAVGRFVERVLSPEVSAEFLAALAVFAAPVARAGVYGSLGQLLLKATAPGVPDFYQGTELWDLSLVDPDNRRPVDFALRQRLLARLEAEVVRGRPELVRRLVEAPADGAIKLYVTQRALTTRRAHRPVFESGDYQALEVQGQHADRVVAFARTHGDRTFLVAVGRLLWPLGAGERPPVGAAAWGDTRLVLPDRLGAARFADAFTGASGAAASGAVPLAGVFSHLPLALLEVVA